jgi:hypothetical protein
MSVTEIAACHHEPVVSMHDQRSAILAGIPGLRGKDLGCWCRPGDPCHADVLLELANTEREPQMKASNAARAAVLVDAYHGLSRMQTISLRDAGAPGVSDIALDPATRAKLLPTVQRLIEGELKQIGVVLDIGTAETAANEMTPGAPYAGGFYAGQIVVDGFTYALVVAPKHVGEIDWVVWKTDWTKATPGTQSVCDGYANTEAMIAAGGHPIADWILKVRNDWHDDAHIPSRDELEVIYRNLKPTASSNYTYASRAARWGVDPGKYNCCDGNGNGHNASSAPAGDAYTGSSPAQTDAAAFREGGDEAMSRAWYWTSTEFGPGGAWLHDFGDGGQNLVGKLLDLRARAVRKVLI